jgi:hypothetical protein
MRWARYLVDGKETFGIINGEKVIDVLGNPFDGFQQTENTRLLSSTKLLANSFVEESKRVFSVCWKPSNGFPKTSITFSPFIIPKVSFPSTR